MAHRPTGQRGDPGPCCPDGENINSTGEKVANTQGIIANAMYESWLYITGQNSWAGMDKSADYNNNTNTGNGANQIYPPYRVSPSLGNWAYVKPAARSNLRPRQVQPAAAERLRQYLHRVHRQQPARRRDGQLPESRRHRPLRHDADAVQLHNGGGGYYQGTWARFLRNRPDLGSPGSIAATNGMVITYTIDAYNDQQNADFSTMLVDMARQGGGESYRPAAKRSSQ